MSSKKSKMTFLIHIQSHLFLHRIRVIDMSRGIILQILKSLAALEVSCLLGVFKASSKEFKGTSLLLGWSQMFGIDQDILGGISVQIFKS